MLSAKFPFTLNRSHFKRSVKGKKKKKTSRVKVFVPVSPKKIKQGDQMLPCELMLENSDCASLKIDVIKVTDADNYF